MQKKNQKNFAPLREVAEPSAAKYLVLIPSYNTGAKLVGTVAAARQRAETVWVVIDGSTDGSGETLALEQPGLQIIHRAANGGKGAAVYDGLSAAADAGFTHALIMDADGQHPAAAIPDFIELSRQNPAAMILGVPVFDATAPRIRILGRRLSNMLARLETGQPIGDALFGFRLYPLAPLLAVMNETRRMRRFDFDTEAVVRLCWRGVPLLNQPVPVRYFRADEGGVSHFHYVRDNALLAGMHVQLLLAAVRKVSSSFCEQKEPKKL